MFYHIECRSSELPWATQNASIEFKAAKRQVIRVVAVLSNLHDAEEAISIKSKLAIDLRIDLESQGTARLLKLSELIL